MNEPPKAENWQLFHSRIISGEAPTAFAELCELALEYLVSFLQKSYPGLSSDLYETKAIDSLLNYYANPAKFKPEKSNLRTYLSMDALGDLRNEVEKQKRHTKRLINFSDELVEQLSDDGNNDQDDDADWLSKHTTESPTELLEELAQELSPVDLRIAAGIAEGIRNTDYYAQILGIQDLGESEKRHEVKRAKDRIKKTLERFGKRRGKA